MHLAWILGGSSLALLPLSVFIVRGRQRKRLRAAERKRRMDSIKSLLADAANGGKALKQLKHELMSLPKIDSDVGWGQYVDRYWGKGHARNILSVLTDGDCANDIQAARPLYERLQSTAGESTKVQIEALIELIPHLERRHVADALGYTKEQAVAALNGLLQQHLEVLAALAQDGDHEAYIKAEQLIASTRPAKGDGDIDRQLHSLGAAPLVPSNTWPALVVQHNPLPRWWQFFRPTVRFEEAAIEAAASVVNDDEVAAWMAVALGFESPCFRQLLGDGLWASLLSWVAAGREESAAEADDDGATPVG